MLEQKIEDLTAAVREQTELLRQMLGISKAELVAHVASAKEETTKPAAQPAKEEVAAPAQEAAQPTGASAPAAEEQVTYEAVRDLLMQINKASDAGPGKVKAILAECGVEKVPQLNTNEDVLAKAYKLAKANMGGAA